MTPILVVVTGARRIEGSPHEVEARTWLTARLLVIGPDVLVYGDATGPDAWAHDYATKRRVPWFRYTKRGTIERHDGAPVRWTGQPPPAPDAGRVPWGAWLRFRNDTMDEHAARRMDRYDVRLVGLMASTPGTGGTIATINRADALGIPCETEVF